MADEAKKAACTICGGAGYIPIDNLTVRECVCQRARGLRDFLGPEFAMAKLITASPLFTAGNRGEPALIDRTTENLFLKGRWTELLPHFKWSLGCRHNLDTSFRYRVYTDERILNVYLGNEHYGSRSRKTRDDMDSFNSLRDIIVDFDLVLIRLGHLGYKNIAMAGVLKQALMIREEALRPTWLVMVPSSPFGPGHFSYNDELQEYIDEHFDVVDLRGTPDEKPQQRHGFEGATAPLPAADADDVGIGQATAPSVPMPREAIRTDEQDPLGMSRVGRARPGTGRNKKRGGGNGDGPVSL